MSLFRTSFVAAMMAALAPLPAMACDLDGLPGFHRANPFSNAPGFRGMPARPVQPAPSQDRSPARSQDKAAPAASEQNRLQRSWERDENFGPISAEDKATFT